MTDPAATWTAAGGPAFFAYSSNYLVDLKAGMIVDVEASSVNKVAEVHATQTMIERVEQKFAIKPRRLVGDTNDGTAAMLGWLVEQKGIARHIPVWDKSDRTDGTFSSSDFVWDGSANDYRCPAGHILRSRWRQFSQPRNPLTSEGTINYRASQKDCQGCILKSQCCPHTPSRTIKRSIHEDAREVARNIGHTAGYRQSRKDRKKVEILFAHLKRVLKLRQLRLRGMSGAHDEFLLAATVQTLRRMAQWLMGPNKFSKEPTYV
jgi:hypothetical protein